MTKPGYDMERILTDEGSRWVLLKGNKDTLTSVLFNWCRSSRFWTVKCTGLYGSCGVKQKVTPGPIAVVGLRKV